MAPDNQQTVLTPEQAAAEHARRDGILSRIGYMCQHWLEPRPQDAQQVAVKVKVDKFPTSLFGDGWD